MKNTFKAAGACVCVIIFLLCMSCNIFGKDIKDDLIPDSFEPVAWKDTMIFLATDEGPCQVQLWDTETRKLVKRYNFGVEDRYMYQKEMAVDKDRFWINLTGNQETLVQVDASSGEVRKIALDIRPRDLQYIAGALWVFDPHSPWEGFKTRRLSRDGILEQSLTINGRDLDRVPVKNILYIDGEYLVPVQAKFNNPNGKFYIANLSKGGELAEIPVETLYPSPLLENLGAVVYDSIFHPPDPKISVLAWYMTDTGGYADVMFYQSASIWRWYYTVESFKPFKLSGPVITHHRQGDRSNLFLSKTGKHLFIGGRLMTQLVNDPEYYGLEIGVYPAEGGEELAFFRLWNSNQLTYAKINGEIWFAKNIWSWDYKKDAWNFNGETEAYIFDEINVKLYRTNADGAVVLVQEYDGKE